MFAGMRLAWFTDTLGDVNGVSRFILDMQACAARSGRDVEVITSTAISVPERPGIVNFPPVRAWKMPRYEHLEIVLPPARRMLRHARERRPDIIHVSTPGPVGLVGLLAARRLGAPLIGTYHTDFPSYIDRLFGGRAHTTACEWFMRWFYSRCRIVFSRSDEFVPTMERVGILRDRIVVLRSGIDLSRFGTHARAGSATRPRRDERVFGHIPGLEASATVKVLYVGRVSVEKNLPMLTRAWKRVEERARKEGLRATLIVVGDGPYLDEMRRTLAGRDAHFLGFRHGEELASLYASADLFVFPSTTDTLGQSVMEAQASGLPALVSDRGGPRSIVREGETGRIVRGDDDRAWADAVLELVRDGEARRRWGSAAAESMQGRDVGASFEHFWSVCESVSARTARPGPRSGAAGC